MRVVTRRVLLVLLFVALGACVYAPAIGAHFVSDDFQLIKSVADGGPFGLWTCRSGFFRPLVSLSFFLDHAAWGLRAAPWHATNLLLHIANALLVTMFAARLWSGFMGRTDGARAGAIAGLLFLLHGSHSESVAWVSGRTDLLAAFFALLCLNATLAHRHARNGWHAVVAFLACALALGCKESAATLPLIALVVGLIPDALGQSCARGRWLLHAMLLALLPAYVFVRAAFVGAIVGGYGAAAHLAPEPARLAAALASYVFRAAAPALAGGVFNVLAWIGLALTGIALVAGFAVAECRGRSLFMAFAVCFALALAPAAMLGASLFDSQGERFLYIPTMFSSILLAYLLAHLRSRALVHVIVAALIAVGGISAFRSATNWRAAGDLSASIIRQLDGADEGKPLAVVNLPDNVRGAYVFRNGLQEAWDLTVGRPRDVGVCLLYAIGAGMPVVRVSEGCDGFHIAWEPRAPIVPTPRSARREYAKITPFGRATCEWDIAGPAALVFRIRAGEDARTWLHLSEGTLSRVESNPSL